MNYPQFVRDYDPVSGLDFSYEISSEMAHVICHNLYAGGELEDTFGLTAAIHYVIGDALASYKHEIETDGYTMLIRDTRGKWHRCEYNTQPYKELLFDAQEEVDYPEEFDNYFPGHTFDHPGEP